MAIVRLRNINPLGRVDLPLIGRQGDHEGEGIGCLEPGEVFDGPDVLLEQVGNYELADKPAKRAPTKRAPRKASKPKAAAPAVAAPTEGDDV